MMGESAERELTGEQAMAWEGMLEVSRTLRRGAEQAMTERFGLSVSMLGVTGRLALAHELTMRQTALAGAMGLSLSRVSRVVDLLRERALVERRTCPSDARATNVTLTPQGIELTALAQRELHEYVSRCFFERLEPGEAEVLAAVFARVIDRPVDSPAAG